MWEKEKEYNEIFNEDGTGCMAKDIATCDLNYHPFRDLRIVSDFFEVLHTQLNEKQ